MTDQAGSRHEEYGAADLSGPDSQLVVDGQQSVPAGETPFVPKPFGDEDAEQVDELDEADVWDGEHDSPELPERWQAQEADVASVSSMRESSITQKARQLRTIGVLAAIADLWHRVADRSSSQIEASG